MLESTIRSLAETCDIRMMGTDQWNSSMLAQSLMADGVVEVVEIRQTMAGLSLAMKTVERLLRTGQLFHEDHPVALWCFGNVRVATDGNENIKPMKNRSIDRIDIVVAWIIAMATALLHEEPDAGEGIFYSPEL